MILIFSPETTCNYYSIHYSKGHVRVASGLGALAERYGDGRARRRNPNAGERELPLLRPFPKAFMRRRHAGTAPSARLRRGVIECDSHWLQGEYERRGAARRVSPGSSHAGGDGLVPLVEQAHWPSFLCNPKALPGWASER